MRSQIHRRDWLRAAAVAGASLTVLRDSRSARGYFANEKLGVALVGLSGRGEWFVETVPRIGENVVALCDVNQKRAAEAFKKFPDVPKFQDFRKMLDGKGQADRRRLRGHARQHPRRDLGGGDARGQARLLREAADARRGRGPRLARDRRRSRAWSRRWATRARRPRPFAGRWS